MLQRGTSQNNIGTGINVGHRWPLVPLVPLAQEQSGPTAVRERHLNATRSHSGAVTAYAHPVVDVCVRSAAPMQQQLQRGKRVHIGGDEELSRREPKAAKPADVVCQQICPSGDTVRGRTPGVTRAHRANGVAQPGPQQVTVIASGVCKLFEGSTCRLYPVAGNGDCGFLAMLRISPPITPEHTDHVRHLRQKIADHAAAISIDDLPTIWWGYDDALTKFLSTLPNQSPGRTRQLDELTSPEREQWHVTIGAEWRMYLDAVASQRAVYEARGGAYVCIKGAHRSGWYKAMALTRSAAHILQSDVCCLPMHFSGGEIAVYLAQPRRKGGQRNLHKYTQRLHWQTQLAPRLQWQFWFEALCMGMRCKWGAQQMLGMWDIVRAQQWQECIASLKGIANRAGTRAEQNVHRTFFSELLVDWLRELINKRVAHPVEAECPPPLIVIVHDNDIHFSYVESTFRCDERFRAMAR